MKRNKLGQYTKEQENSDINSIFSNILPPRLIFIVIMVIFALPWVILLKNPFLTILDKLHDINSCVYNDNDLSKSLFKKIGCINECSSLNEVTQSSKCKVCFTNYLNNN